MKRKFKTTAYLGNQTQIVYNFLSLFTTIPGVEISKEAEEEEKEEEKQNSDEKFQLSYPGNQPSLLIISCHFLQLSRAR